MTNKFRDELNRLLDLQEGYTIDPNGCRAVQIKALTIAAELHDDAETIKALDEAGDNAARGTWWVDNGITVQGENGNYGIRPDRGDNVYFVVSAANARPVIKKLAKLVKECEK